MPQTNPLSSHRRRQLMMIFNYYRIGLALMLFFLGEFFWSSGTPQASLSLQTFIIAVFMYLIVCGFAVVITVRDMLSQASILAIMITDVMLLTLIMKASGGVISGVGNLVLVSVATGALFLTFNNSLLLAAFAASAIVYTEILSSFGINDKGYIQAAMLGVAFFAITIVVQYVLYRVRVSEQIAEEQAEDILDLQSMNALVLQRMRTGIIVCSPAGDIRTYNDAAAILVSNEHDGQPVSELPDKLVALLSQWLKQQPIESHILRVHPKMPDVFVNFTSLQDRPDSDILIFLQDITQTTQQAQQMKLASLGRLTASIAHEIRNPLGAISHAAQLLGESTHLDKTDHRMVEIIKNHSVRMNAIIENVLQLSRRSKSNPEVLNLAEWVNEFKQVFSEAYPDATIEIDITETIKIRFDPSHLHQVITNLINNGLRYSKQRTGKSRITLHGGIVNANDQPFIDVIDYGPGIKNEIRDQLFEPFSTTEATGTGLGLFICRELCEANQSRLDLVEHDRTDIGCQFRITFSHPDRLITME